MHCFKLATQQENAVMQFDVFAALKIMVLEIALLRKNISNAQTVVVLMRQFIEVVRYAYLQKLTLYAI